MFYRIRWRFIKKFLKAYVSEAARESIDAMEDVIRDKDAVIMSQNAEIKALKYALRKPRITIINRE